MSATAVMAYLVVANESEARVLGRTLVEERLAACVNILPRMTSLYWWKGVIEEAQEVVLIAKTADRLFSDLVRRVRELHSYTVPCVLSIPVSAGNQGYLDWLFGEIRDGTQGVKT